MHNNDRRATSMPMTSRHPFHNKLYASAVLLLCNLPIPVQGTPLALARRDNSNGGGLSTSVWIPIFVVLALFLLFGILTWAMKTGRLSFLFGPRSTSAPPAQNGTRELTADQLAGATNGGATSGNTGPTTTRRPRRPRRTPSQISTISLPAYNKEPGEQELVIFRGPQDMEDVTMPNGIVMTTVDEDGENSIHSGEQSQVSTYTPMPITPNNVPLLQDGTHSDIHRERSFDTMDGSQETSSLMRTRTNVSEDSDPRGEAPAYFEVVDPSDHQGEPQRNSSVDTPQNNAEVPSASSVPPEVTSRRSGIRTLLNRMSVYGGNHTRAPSGQSVLSTAPSHGRDSSSRASHRPSASGSGSMFRTLSRQKSSGGLSGNRLNSPSLISLNSISSPLTHTVVRTEFTYPKAGPTPEQLKLISSRESFARFGMPYGPDAVAFAASSSRQDLDAPPPDFDAAASDVHLPRTVGPSRLRSSSNVLDNNNASEPEPTVDSDSNNHDDISPAWPMDVVTFSAPINVADPVSTDNQVPSTAEPGPSGLATSDRLSMFEEPHQAPSLTVTPAIKPEQSKLTVGLGQPSTNAGIPVSRATSASMSMRSFATAEESFSSDESTDPHSAKQEIQQTPESSGAAADVPLSRVPS